MTGKAKGAVVIFVTAVVGYVLMATFAPEQDYRGILTFAGVAAAWLGLAGQQETIKTSVKKVEQQTNGVLDKRIRDAVRQVLAEMGIKATLAPEPPKPPKRVRKPRIIKGTE